MGKRVAQRSRPSASKRKASRQGTNHPGPAGNTNRKSTNNPSRRYAVAKKKDPMGEKLRSGAPPG